MYDGSVMDAKALFQDHRDEMLRRWTDAVFSTYPFETKGFLRTKMDPFGNPVANMTREAAATLYDAMAGGDAEPEDIKAALDRFVKLRAVQDFTPSQALGVFLLLKPLMRELLLPRMQQGGAMAEYLEAESRLDSLCLLAFDMYVRDREVVAQNRISEIKNRYAQLERWAQRIERSEAIDSPDK